MDDYPEDSEEVEVIYLDDEDESNYETMEVPDGSNFNESEQFETIDVSKITFNKHSKSVFCGDISKDGSLAATGGEDDCAFLWSLENGDVKLECTGHKDSVTAVCFNHDSKLLATGDMAGMVQVWDIKDNKLVWCYEGDDMEWLMWHPLANILLSGSQSGDIFIWQVPQGNCKILPSHGYSCTCGKILPDGKNVVAGYEDGQIKLWDIKEVSVKWNFVDPQKASVTSIAINSDGSLCSVAPSSNVIKLVDGKCLATLLSGTDTDIETHAFSTDLNLLITGSLKGQISVWDLHKNVVRHQAKLDSGITVLKLGLNGKVIVGCTDGAIYVCDIRTGVLLETLTGHRSDILSLCVSCNGNFILTSSDDKTAKVFSIQN